MHIYGSIINLKVESIVLKDLIDIFDESGEGADGSD